MKKFSRMTYDNFTTSGEINEGFPLYSNNIESLYSMSDNCNNLFADLELRVVAGAISRVRGDSEIVKRISNVSVVNECMNFTGEWNSFIELDKSLIRSKNFEIEMKFKITDFSSTIRTLFMAKRETITPGKENELSIIVNNKNRQLYSDMYNVKGIYTTKQDFDKAGAYSLSSVGAINNDIWYTVKFCKYGSIITCHINDMLTRSIICEGDNLCDYIFIGQEADIDSGHGFDETQSFKGLIEYIKITEIKDVDLNPTISLKAKSLLSDYTLNYKWTPKVIGTYEILKVGDVLAKSQNNTLVIYSNSKILASVTIYEGHDYNISYIFNNSLKSLGVYIYDKTTHEEVLDISPQDIVNGNTSVINMINNNTVHDVSAFNKCLSKLQIKGLSNKRFSLDKSGNIVYDINETDMHDRLSIGAGAKKYNMQLTYDANSDCNSITNDIDIYSVDGGAKTGLYQPTCLDLFARYNEDAKPITEDIGWNIDLHSDAYSISGWSTGYNAGVPSKDKGYHAKIIRGGIERRDMCISMINCNEKFNNKNRWMGMSYRIDKTVLWDNCSVGDTLYVSLKSIADIDATITVGIHRNQKSTNSYGFGSDGLKEVKIIEGQWNEYIVEFIIDSDWDLTKHAVLYLYNYATDNATVNIQDIYIAKNSKLVSSDIIKDDVDRKLKINFSKSTSFDYSSSWTIMYRTKIIDLNNNMHYDSLGQMYWGIQNSKFIFSYKSKSCEINIPLVDLENEWITIGLSSNRSKIELTVCTRLGIFKGELTAINPTSTEFYNSTHKYDIQLGGKDDVNYGCAIYKDLVIIKNEYKTSKIIEDYFRTKLSYHNNLLVSSINITESNIL